MHALAFLQLGCGHVNTQGLGLQGISEHFLLNQTIPQEESSALEKRG